jgi:hypothetical protein
MRFLILIISLNFITSASSQPPKFLSKEKVYSLRCELSLAENKMFFSIQSIEPFHDQEYNDSNLNAYRGIKIINEKEFCNGSRIDFYDMPAVYHEAKVIYSSDKKYSRVCENSDESIKIQRQGIIEIGFTKKLFAEKSSSIDQFQDSSLKFSTKFLGIESSNSLNNLNYLNHVYINYSIFKINDLIFSNEAKLEGRIATTSETLPRFNGLGTYMTGNFASTFIFPNNSQSTLKGKLQCSMYEKPVD